MVVYAFNPSTQEAVASLREFEASLVYKVSSRTVRTVTQRNLVLKNQKKKRKKRKKGRQKKKTAANHVRKTVASDQLKTN